MSKGKAKMKIDIIGAGIGGLTTAIALKEKGFSVNVFEQAKEIRPVGAGIILANNAMQVYEKLKLRKTIEENGHSISSLNITDFNLKLISKVDLKYFEDKHQVKNIAIHRGVLQQILADKLDSELILDHALSSVKRVENQYELRFENGISMQSAVLLGADGLNSVVRRQLFPEATIRNVKQVCWRGVTDFQLPVAYQHELNEAWGRGDRFGFVQIAENKVYWYALKTFKNSKEEFSIDELEHYFHKYHPVIREILNSTPKERIHIAEIADLQPTKLWHKANVCLIGDAAHATTPNMGQGACQAIEDAYVLSECLSKYDTVRAFAEYQKLRLKKAHEVVNTSWHIGKLAHMSNPVAIGIRNQLMRWTPDSLNRRQSDKIFELATV